jgi:hypothetical protein
MHFGLAKSCNDSKVLLCIGVAFSFFCSVGIAVAIGTENDSVSISSQKIQVQSTNTSQTNIEVPCFGIFELKLTGTGISVNKYTGVWVKGVFQGPTRVIEIDGFWDGGDIWKIRMTPTEVGHWTFSIGSSHPQLVSFGSFDCVASSSKGFIRVNPDYPRTFMFDDGTPWLWKSETSWRGFLYILPFEERWKPYIDLRAQQGYNAVQIQLDSNINGDDFWRNEGGHVFELVNNVKNFDKLNPTYFIWADRRLEYALSKNIIPVLFLTWAQEYIRFSRAQFERYLKYIVARYAAYNVIWCLCGEYNEITKFNKSVTVFKELGTLIKQKDPYKHLLSLQPTSNKSSSEFAAEPWFDFIMQQTYKTLDPKDPLLNNNWHSDILKDYSFKKPIVNVEYAYAGKVLDNYVRYGAWDIITAGGFFTAGFLTTYAPDKGGWDLAAYPKEQNEMVYLFQFINKTKWWRLASNDALTNNGFCLAKPDEEYIIYSKNGGAATIDISAIPGSAEFQWFNPRTGTFSPDEQVASGSAVQFTPPFAEDWVLHITAFQDVIPPNPPQGLIITR